MNIQLNIDWKFAAAAGFGTAVVILAFKVDPEDAKEAFVSGANALADTLAFLGGKKRLA